MRVRLAWLALLAAVLSVGMLWIEHWSVHVNDYGLEAAPSYVVLRAGHVLAFLRSLPLYGGSLIIRAPAAMAPALWGGDAMAVYRFSAVPCVLAGAALGVWLARELLLRNARLLSAVLAVVVCAANPLTLRALAIGHPEDLLGGVLCVASVLLALRGRAVWAGVALGVAVANKQWALLAAGPMLLALPHGRTRALVAAAIPALALEAPLLLVGGSSLASPTARTVAADTEGIFHPQSIWWFFGAPGHWVPAMGKQILHDYRTSPAWLDSMIHPAIVWLTVPLTWLCWREPARGRERADVALLLLALLFLLRCMLDPWDVAYYPIPFILALASWEVVARGRAPLLAAAASGTAWLVMRTAQVHLGGTGQALVFLAVSVPAAAALARALYRPAARRAAVSAGRLSRRRAAAS